MGFYVSNLEFLDPTLCLCQQHLDGSELRWIRPQCHIAHLPPGISWFVMFCLFRLEVLFQRLTVWPPQEEVVEEVVVLLL